jgi:CHAD domain-containing protein
MSAPKATTANKPARLSPEMAYRDAMTSLIGERWGEVWKAVPVALEGSDPEGVHDVRVASRRLRAAMDVAVGCFPDGWYRPLHRAAKEITRALGEVRDRDVLLEALTTERESSPAAERPGLDRLIARVDRERAAARVEMESFLNDLLASPVPRQVVARFGPDAAPPATANVNRDGAREPSV